MCVQKVHLSYLQAAYMGGFLINLFLIRALKKHVCLINDCVVFEEQRHIKTTCTKTSVRQL